MAILVDNPRYAKTGDIDEADLFKLRADLASEFGEVRVDETDSGPGASAYEYFVEVATLATIAITIFSLPGLIADNTKRWKALFDKLAAFLKSKNMAFDIDAQSARCLALFYVLNNIGGGYNSIQVISLIRHSVNVVPRVSDVTDETTPALDSLGPREAHLQAVDQANGRYVALVEVDHRCFTVVIERDGRCGYIESIL